MNAEPGDLVIRLITTPVNAFKAAQGGASSTGAQA